MNTQTKNLQTELYNQRENIIAWFEKKESSNTPIFYSSVDIRDSNIKSAVVDTNFFPAGFNNLWHVSQKQAVNAFSSYMNCKFPQANKILIVIEEHTRNTWYLENARVLDCIVKSAGYESKMATVLDDEDVEKTTLKTATDQPITIHNLDNIVCKKKGETFDLVILNHDMTSGIPSCLEKIETPIIPSLKAGWYNRSKAHHFECTQTVVNEFSSKFNVDPWLLSCKFDVATNININEEADRNLLAEKAKILLSEIQKKYDEYNINSKPYLVLKASSGTYGMGVKTIDSPEDILKLNRKSRNNLSKGKSANIISNFILQEGVESTVVVDEQPAELCMYSIGFKSVGSFYRLNTKKSARDNLNSSGMAFRQVDDKLPLDEETFFKYQVLAKLSGLASIVEVLELETQ